MGVATVSFQSAQAARWQVGRRAVVVAMVIVILLTSCGSADTEPATMAEASADRAQSSAAASPGGSSAEDDAATGSGAGVAAGDVADQAVPEDLAFTEAGSSNADDPWLVTVATARDEVHWIDTRETPDGEPAAIEWGVWNPTPFGTTLAMMVTEGQPSDDWVRVQVAVPPNHSEAWVRTADFTFSTHRFHAEIDLAAHQLTVWEGDELIAQTLAVTGKTTTPTPLGRFYVNDLVAGPNEAYGPWVLSLSAYSEVLDTFGGGEPVIAIHGTNSPELVGSALSNGCIRVPNDIIELLADVVPLGTPVDIIG